MTTELKRIADASRRYGGDPLYVFGGGGNTSWKNKEHMYIKPSGVALATIQPEDFVKVDRGRMRAMFDVNLPTDSDGRESMVKDLMMAAVCPDSSGRPSVEAPLHELLAETYIIHMHSTLINGLACALDGAAKCAELFPEAMWVPYVDPGFILCLDIKVRLETLAAAGKPEPSIIILQSHGVFVSGNSIEEIDERYGHMIDTLASIYAKKGLSTEKIVGNAEPDVVAKYAPQLRTLLGYGNERCIVKSSAHFIPAAGPLSPDHVVYAKAQPLTGDPDAATIDTYTERYGYKPVICTVGDAALFAAGDTMSSAQVAMDAARDASLVHALTAAFGGPRYLDDREREFIENWEVEHYRKKLFAGEVGSRRLQSKVALVTGGAQGFGLGIAHGLAAEGAVVVVADINAEGAQAAAAAIEDAHGKGKALGMSVDVSDEASVAALANSVLSSCGGLDLLIVNAGVLRAGSVKELDKADWDFVTAVNYTGYFLCVKHLAPVMAAQNVEGRGTPTDIVQINSKSGLEGSSRNAAYAGSKFGGIGLTQSFALELIEDRIKVNSICPGNYFDGPLWSDPDNGLFVQYLNTGKVPGAKSAEDVKADYAKRVPMGRGCLPEDVVVAILYCVEQQYETGQAIPVTGGQVMR